MSEQGRARLSRHAGPLALAAGLLLVVPQLVMWPTLDQSDKVGTALNPAYQAGGVAYLAGFCALLLALVAVHGLQDQAGGRFGTFALCAALVGTMLLGGDLWFETFVVPWLAGALPQIYTIEPGGLIAAGALASYFAFAAGWALFGIATFRAGVIPRPIGVALVVGGLIGWSALVAPGGVPLGLVLVWLGAWILRSKP